MSRVREVRVTHRPTGLTAASGVFLGLSPVQAYTLALAVLASWVRHGPPPAQTGPVVADWEPDDTGGFLGDGIRCVALHEEEAT